MEWLLQVKLLAHFAPLGKLTPHCFSTSTGPLGLGTFGFGSSFFFFFLESLSSSTSALRFLLFLEPSSPALPFTALLRALPPLLSTMISLSSSVSLSSPLSAFSLALAAASLASFFFRALSCFDFKHPAMCSLAVRLRTGRLQCLQVTVSRRSSRGLPLGKEAIVSSSISGRM